MSPTTLINDLRDMEFPVDQLLIEQLNDKLSECLPEFTLSITDSFDENSSLSATLFYRWSKNASEYILFRYDAWLTYPADSDSNKNQTFHLSNGFPRITLREAYNLLQGRFVNKDLVPIHGGAILNTWLQLDFHDLDNMGNAKFIHYAPLYPYDLEHALHFYPIDGLNDPAYFLQLVQRLKRGDQIKVTFGKRSKFQKVYIGANPRTKLINLDYKTLKTSQKNENDHQQIRSFPEKR